MPSNDYEYFQPSDEGGVLHKWRFRWHSLTLTHFFLASPSHPILQMQLYDPSVFSQCEFPSIHKFFPPDFMNGESLSSPTSRAPTGLPPWSTEVPVLQLSFQSVSRNVFSIVVLWSGILILFCPGDGLVSGSLGYLHQIYMVHLHRMFQEHIHRCQGSRVCDLIHYYLHSIQDRKCISILPVQLEDNLSALDKGHLVRKIHRVIHTDMAFINRLIQLNHWFWNNSWSIRTQLRPSPFTSR